MWNTVRFSQGSAVATNASTNASWELPVANMALALPRSSTVLASSPATSAAAARANAAPSSYTSTWRRSTVGMP